MAAPADKPDAVPHGMLYVISAPSGAGKTSLIKALLTARPGLRVSVSHTTRTRRRYEQAGVDYHFISEAEFNQLIEAGLFLEYAKVFDHFYGTSRQWVTEQLGQGQDIILEIDWQGAQQVRRLLPGTVAIFILPPALSTLQSRLAARGDERTIIERRMQAAKDEIKQYRSYDYLIINEDFDQAVQNLLTIIAAGKHSYRLQGDYFDAFVARLLTST